MGSMEETRRIHEKGAIRAGRITILDNFRLPRSCFLVGMPHTIVAWSVGYAGNVGSPESIKDQRGELLIKENEFKPEVRRLRYPNLPYSLFMIMNSNAFF